MIAPLFRLQAPVGFGERAHCRAHQTAPRREQQGQPRGSHRHIRG